MRWGRVAVRGARRGLGVGTLVLALAAVAGCSATRTIDAEAAAAGANDAGCTVDERAPEGGAAHLDQAGAPDPDELYAERPPASGAHFGSWLAVGVYRGAVDERAAVHNLEHGGVVAWYDPDALSEPDVAALEDWAEDRNSAGLANRAGGGLIVAPFTDAPLSAPLALRGWLVGADCQRFDEAFADGFLLDHFGRAGKAPEGHLAPDVGRVLQRVG
ncbi:DUF3105 domain-containing protein [Egicoccus sp. AB-alg2]|uniref:DUF3105 domain-containing protein n=1 Tax=Egicoccus sp. AB-alg2 TaxID=3242693 RepID=UPI00359ED019